LDKIGNANCIAIIAAAGLGERLRSETKDNPKVFYKLLTPEGELSLLALSVRAIASTGIFSGIIIACDKRYQNIAEIEFKKNLRSRTPPIEFIAGGATRQETVYLALKSLEGKDVAFVAIHDGARPFVSSEALIEVVTEAMISRAAVLVEPVTSTLKKVSVDLDETSITETFPRTEFVLAQTPQVFEYDLIYQAHRAAKENSETVTDDSELVEKMGIKPTAVFNKTPNPKITEPRDLELARGLALRN
jgi:2-C-methyl-D-erythritol 4-phosphate cytidylyltransferase